MKLIDSKLFSDILNRINRLGNILADVFGKGIFYDNFEALSETTIYLNFSYYECGAFTTVVVDLDTILDDTTNLRWIAEVLHDKWVTDKKKKEDEDRIKRQQEQQAIDQAELARLQKKLGVTV